ncbi:hypothetical protein MNBD_ALPHA09-693 [hydrothermal vent metagenome]|uniref:Tetratricopeptide repeat protein n=1 Tax=hydrothermal vent metagenome TaxID=652676 RepID=A0A3B0SY30_9ZZZZ
MAQANSPLRGEVVAREENGHARLVFTFPEPIEFERTIANGVLVLSLKTPVDIDLSGLALSVPSYIVAARRGPDDASLRFALARRLTVAVLPAAERLFVDLLPEGWQGPLPTLPEDVVAELAERAAKIERAKRLARNGVSNLSSVPLTLRVGRYPTFSRIVFEWNDAVETILSRSGNTVKIKFNRPGEVDLTRLNVDPPPNVRGARMDTEDGRTEVQIDVAIGADVRGFRENTSYVLDIASDDGLGLDEIDVVTQGQVSGALPPAPTGDEKIRLSGTASPPASEKGDQIPGAKAGEAIQGVPLAADSEPDPAKPTNFASSTVDPGTEPEKPPTTSGNLEISVSPLVIAGRPETPTPVPPDEPPDAAEPKIATGAPVARSPVAEQISAAQDGAAAQTGTQAPDGQAEELALVQMPDAAASEPEPSGPLPESIFDDPDQSEVTMEASAGEAPKAKPKVEAKIVGETLRITLPFGTPVAGAVFQRAQTLWMVFDADDALDFAAIAREGADRVNDVSVVVSGRMQVIRIKLKRRYLITASPQGRGWLVSVGDMVLDPATPVVLERALRADGRSKVVANLPDNGNVHWISDAEVGDQLAVVTAFGPARGMIKRQEFVEFAALPTAHGLVIKPIADDLAVRIAYADVVVTRDSGLTVSAARWRGYVPGQKGTGDGTRPGFINFDDWQQGGREDYRNQVKRISSTISRLESENRAGARLELARLYLAHQLGPEAYGMLQLGLEEDPEVENDPVFRAMRGVANIFMNHFKEARADFDVRGLAQDPHSALWRGIIASRQGRWREAQLAFAEGGVALDAYPADRQAIFRLAAARAALMTNDLESATRHLDALPNADLDETNRRKADLLGAKLARALGRTEQALAIFRQIADGPWGQEAAEAQFNRISLEVQKNAIPVADAIEQLETLAISWRGDDIELSVMQNLAELHVSTGNYQRALGIMREAVMARNGGERTRQIHQDMTEIFERLFLDDGARDMKPLKALSLFYEFRELTPVGRRGDEMIRKLVRRLIEVDLLSQASDLLNHQVENRLIGAARAQVAADLALIHLMNHKPELALRAIRRTRQAVLPISLQRKRNTLEARALAELGRVDMAVELLNTMEGADIEQLKADALWRGKRWQQAGLQFEKMLGDSWQGDADFSDVERLNVMRAGISFSLANDRIGTDRLRRKFIAKMSSSPDAVNFDVVTKVGQNTGADQGKGIAFNTLAAEIAEIDTLSAFIENFRKRYGEVGTRALGDTSDAGGAAAAQNG